MLNEVRTESLRAAGFQDTDDCAKKLLCELARKSKFDSEIDSLPEIPNASSFPGGKTNLLSALVSYIQEKTFQGALLCRKQILLGMNSC